LKFSQNDTYGNDVNINLTAGTNLNFFKELDDQIKTKNNKDRTNKLGNQNSN